MPPVLKAALWMLGTLTSLALMAISGRELSAELSTLQILFFRSAIGLLIILAVIRWAGRHHLRTRQPGMQVLRNMAHYMGQFGWFYGISLLPLAQVFALEFTMPIWATLLAPLLLRETITPRRALVVAIGFAGILVVVRPGVVPISPAALGVLMAAVGYAFAYTLTKKLTRTDTALAIVFYMCLVQLPLGLIPSLFDWVTPSAAMWPWVVAVSVTGLGAHYCLARAFSEADAIVVVPMEFLRLPLIAVAGLVFYGEALDPWVLGGAAVIFSGNFLNIWGERRRAAG
ncbi:MAG: EamA family transporter [Rhodospirillales bacterium CG15_BIG_FIL_POST_REV_8_21_14_020_66_15]|nr:MAG: EamA family transporter [Rhodospirillales bacterium CG15_BIG_FIL_POST_REV_8_21_14_020_66_15]